MAAYAPQWHSLLGECCASCTPGDSHDGLRITTSTDSHTHLLQHQEYTPGLADSSEQSLVQRGNSSHCSIQKPRVSSAIFFLVSKKTGVLCAIIDLSCLNHHLVIPQFKMETQASVRLSIKESKWTVSIWHTGRISAHLHGKSCTEILPVLGQRFSVPIQLGHLPLVIYQGGQGPDSI